MVAAVAALTSAPATAGAAPTDPKADSPSGTIYQIPLDLARRDAAPRRGGRGGGPASGGSADPDGSPIRSENNFGSSSVVPGLAGAQAIANGRRAGGAVATGGRGTATDPGAGGGRYGAGAGGDGASPSARAAGAGGPSEALAVSLLAAAGLVGAGAGTAAARSRRRP
jgi:hypothetical protein